MLYDFQGKNVAVIGLSTEGMEMVRYLSKEGALITACDQKTDQSLPEETVKELKTLGVNLSFGKNYLEIPGQCEYIFRSPGMPLWHLKIQQWKNEGKIITSLTKLFFAKCPCPIIGVSGTKGKGTTSTLAGEILKESGKKVFVGGNIGTPLINNLPEIDKESIVVLELSSFQLEDLDKSPHIAVVLNITGDHFASSSLESPNYHKSRADYLLAKTNLVKYQMADDFAVLNADYEIAANFNTQTPANAWYFSIKNKVSRGTYVSNGLIILNDRKKETVICRTDEVLLRGIHNLENITAAITASYLAGASLKALIKTVKTFKGLEHRLELVDMVKGVGYYNDSFSTTPETTIAAIRSFTEPVILIAGGSEKGSDYTRLGKEITGSSVKKLILIGMMAEKIKNAVENAGGYSGKIITGLESMPGIVESASKEAVKGDIVLLSPACASFDLFKNYKDRGLQFKNEVKKLSLIKD